MPITITIVVLRTPYSLPRAVEVRPKHPTQHALQPFPAPMHAIPNRPNPIQDQEAEVSWAIVSGLAAPGPFQ